MSEALLQTKAVTEQPTAGPPPWKDACLFNDSRDGDAQDFSGHWRCRGCKICDIIPVHITFVPCRCCLWGVWSCFYIPLPGISCVTVCLCRQGKTFITEKGGFKTGELLVVGSEETPMLAYYGVNCGKVYEISSCYCTK